MVALLVLSLGGIGLLAAVVRSEVREESEGAIASGAGGDSTSSDDTASAPAPCLLSGDPAAFSAALARTLRHGVPEDRARAVSSLGEAVVTSTTSMLIARALDDEDADVRVAARLAQRRAGPAYADAVASLRRRVACDDEHEAADVLRTLGAVAGDRPETLDALAEALASPSPTRARGAAAGLALAGESGVARLRDALERDADVVDALRGVTVRAVSDPEEARLAAALTGLLDDRHRALRTLALRSIASGRPSATSSALATAAVESILAAPDRDADERRLADEALGVIAPASRERPASH